MKTVICGLGDAIVYRWCDGGVFGHPNVQTRVGTGPLAIRIEATGRGGTWRDGSGRFYAGFQMVSWRPNHGAGGKIFEKS
jgi:hypothetical protein